MRQRIIGIVRGFAIAIAILLAFAVAFDAYTGTLSEEMQGEVLILALPFVAVFVSIILAFACLIVVVSIAFDRAVPQRSYRPVEALIIGGILLGVVGLFQGWKLFAYEFGFLLVLVSTLLFMVWSHLAPKSPTASRRLPPLPQNAHVIGVALGIVVCLAVAVGVALSFRPTEPYGISRQIWNLMMDEEARAATAEAAESDYQNYEVPLIALVSLMPGAIVYFITREVVAAARPSAQQT
jgi:hypothetical protein